MRDGLMQGMPRDCAECGAERENLVHPDHPSVEESRDRDVDGFNLMKAM